MAATTIVEFVSELALGEANDVIIPLAQLPDEVAAIQSFLSVENLLLQEEIVRKLTIGEEIYSYLQAIPCGRSARNQGYTYNRVIKVLNSKELFPATFSVVSYGVMKVQAKGIVHSAIKAIDLEVLGREFIDKIHDAILNGSEAAPIANTTENEGGVVINRWALLLEFYVDPASREELTRYFTKLSPEIRPATLTDGIANHKRAILNELYRICTEVVAPAVRNSFAESWPALAGIHPENGTFTSVDMFVQLLGEARSTWDVLKANLSQSGTQESGIILDSTAFEFCKFGQRTCKLNQFYMWLRWKDQDLLFLSNSLAVGVAADSNAPTPYSRVTSGTSNSQGKLSSAERRAAKNTHLEKVLSSIGDTISKTVMNLQSSKSSAASENSVIARTAAYIAKEDQMRMSISCKRFRDIIESTSFSSLSPNTRRKIQEKYVIEINRTLTDEY